MTGQPALTPYVPRLLLRHLDETPDAAVRRFDGTLVFIDVSGFTQLSERLARQGREGAERLAGRDRRAASRPCWRSRTSPAAAC